MSRKTFMVIMTIATALRVASIWSAPLWYDENFTLILARLPFDKMIAATAGDVHPPLWYLIEWMIYHAAPNLPAWFIRVPAMIFSIASVYLFVKVTDELHTPRTVQTIASVMMAIMPMQLWFAQEGRMYAMLEALVLVALYIVITKDYFRWLWLAFAAMLYTQNYGLFYMVVICFVALATAERDERIAVFKWLAVSGGVAVILYLPWAYVVAQQMAEIKGRYWIMDASIGAALKTIYQQFWMSSMLGPGIITSYVISYGGVILGAYAIMRSKHSAARVIIPMAFLPLGIAWMLSLIWQPILLFRPLIGTSPFWYLIAAWSVTAFEGEDADARSLTRAMLYSACLAVPLVMFGVAGYYINGAKMKGDGAVSTMIESLRYVERNWQDGDVIYYTDDGPMINLMPYTDLPQYRMPDCDVQKTSYAPVLGSLSDSTRIAVGAQVVALDNIPHKRAWIFAPRSPLHPQCYDALIAPIAPEGDEVVVVDKNQYLSSGVWLLEAGQ